MYRRILQKRFFLWLTYIAQKKVLLRKNVKNVYLKVTHATKLFFGLK